MSVEQAAVTPGSAADPPADAGADWHVSGQPRQISLRTSLIMLVLACVLPGVALCSYLLYANYQLEKEKLAQQSELLASQILVELDRELAVIESGLHVLATSELLQNGDLQRFHQIARAALQSQTIYNYVLTDRDGRQVVNTLRPFGKPLPQSGNPPLLAEVFATGRTVLTGLFKGPVTGEPIIAMGVPVHGRNGEVIYSLNVGMLPTQLNELLQRQSLQHGWLAAIVDSSGTIIGRSRDAERFVGQKAVAELRARLQTSHRGSLSTLTKEGVPVSTAYARSDLWNWSVVTGAPKSLIEREMFRMFAGLGAAALLLIVVGSWLALCITQRVVSSVHYLNDAALALRNGKPLALPKVQLHEAEAVGHAIVQASHLMAKVHHRAYHDPLTELATGRCSMNSSSINWPLPSGKTAN